MIDYGCGWGCVERRGSHAPSHPHPWAHLWSSRALSRGGEITLQVVIISVVDTSSYVLSIEGATLLRLIHTPGHTSDRLVLLSREGEITLQVVIITVVDTSSYVLSIEGAIAASHPHPWAHLWPSCALPRGGEITLQVVIITVMDTSSYMLESRGRHTVSSTPLGTPPTILCSI